MRLALDRGTLDTHTARHSLAAWGGGSHPTDDGMRTFPRTAPGEDIIADRLGGQNRWPLTLAHLSGLAHVMIRSTSGPTDESAEHDHYL